MDTTSIILKTDSRGRVRMVPQRRAELLLEFERSGLPATKFAPTRRGALSDLASSWRKPSGLLRDRPAWSRILS